MSICRDCAELALEVLDDDAGGIEPDLVLSEIGSVITMDPRRGGLLGRVRSDTIAVRRGRVVWLGEGVDLPAQYRDLPVLGCDGRIVMPGTVDAAAWLLGPAPAARPEPVLLADEGARSMRAMVARGVTSIDIRVGGGLDPTTETLMLAVARTIGERIPARVSVTWVCSPDMPVALVREVMAPTAARMASSVLVECRGDDADLGPRLSAVRPLRHRLLCREPEPHACLGVMPAAISLEDYPTHCVPAEGPPPIIPWWEPGAARSHWATGARPALATFSDPSTRLLSGMGLAVLTAVDLAGLGLDQALWSVTRGGSLAGGDPDRGWITLGGPADLIVVDGSEPDDVIRRPDGDTAWRVLIGGVEFAG